VSAGLCRPCDGYGVNRETGVSCPECGGTGLDEGATPIRVLSARHLADRFFSALPALIWVPLVAALLVALNYAPTAWRWLGDYGHLYRACMASQPDVATITEWLGQVSECNDFAGKAMRQRSTRQ